jgi:hypothetical protein
MLTRRNFLAASASTLIAARLRAQTSAIDVTAVERARILAAAPAALVAKPTTLADLSTTMATLAAAFLLVRDDKYAARALSLLNILTAIKPSEDILTLIPIAEIAVAIRFLVDSATTAQLSDFDAWILGIKLFLNADPEMTLARDRKDHRASAWLLIASAIARYQRDEHALDDCRRRIRKPTLRNQINLQGQFPEELATANPYRNTLFNFDLLCCICQLLASPFDLLWDYELPDGVGLRIAVATIYPSIADRNKWPGVADAEHFHELPGRRPGLLFAGRAYKRPEYVELWRSLPPEIPPALTASFPIREPLLWTTRALHGF